ncbi:MAG: branched-chain amino acid transaminase [Bacillota bacterium]
MSNEFDRKIWLNGNIISVCDAKINVLSPTCQFGANVFEGIRCYWNDNHKQLYAFKLKEHYKRLRNSIKMMRFEEKYTVNQMEEGLIEIVKANDYKEDIAVRQTVYLDGFGSWNSFGPIGMCINPIPKKRSYDEGKKGIHCCISSWERINDASLSPRIKVGANYINSRLAQLEAMRNGYDSSILLNNYGKVSEAPGSCIFIVRDRQLITPPITASILESITRATIIEIAEKEFNLKVSEREVERTELYIADEIFLCGTAMEIVSVLSVDKLEINQGNPGITTTKLRNKYFEIVRGTNRRYINWLTPIY